MNHPQQKTRQAKEKEDKNIGEITACTMDCPDACSLIVSDDGKGNISLKGNPDHPFTAGIICAKIRKHIRRLQSPERILHPLKRTATGWRTISWEEALTACAVRIQALRHEPSAILHFQGEGAKGVLKQAGKLFFSLLGSSYVKGSLCDAAGYVACLKDFGSRKNHKAEDLLNAASIVNWGKDLSRSSIHTAALIRNARKQGIPVLTISPGGDGNDSFSDINIRIRPGTDRFLAAAAVKLCIERNKIPGHIYSEALDWPLYRNMLSSFSLTQLSRFCDVSFRKIEALFDFYINKQPTATLVGAGLQRYRHGGENVRFINALAFLSGNIGRPGGGSYFHIHSLGNFNLDWTNAPLSSRRRAFLMPTIGHDILTAKDPPVRMIWINGSNVVNQAPHSLEIAQAIEGIEFKVVVDAFMTDTAERADLVLPATLMLEQEDLVGSYLHHYINHVQAVLDPPEEARSDYQILTAIGKLLNPPVILPDADSCFDASLSSPYISSSIEEIRVKKYIKASHPSIPYVNMRFDHADGKYHLPTKLHEEPQPPPDFPLRLLTLVDRNAIHSQILPEDQVSPPTVWVAPDCPVLDKLDPAQDIYLVSPHGQMKVNVEQSPDLHPNSVMGRRGTWLKLGGGFNQLIAAGLTDIGNGAAYYEQYVTLQNGKKIQ